MDLTPCVDECRELVDRASIFRTTPEITEFALILSHVEERDQIIDSLIQRCHGPEDETDYWKITNSKCIIEFVSGDLSFIRLVVKDIIEANKTKGKNELGRFKVRYPLVTQIALVKRICDKEILSREHLHRLLRLEYGEDKFFYTSDLLFCAEGLSFDDLLMVYATGLHGSIGARTTIYYGLDSVKASIK